MYVITAFENTNIKNCRLHAHDSWEIVIYTSGCLKSVTSTETYHVSRGSIVVIPPHMPHSETSDLAYSDICIRCVHMPFSGSRSFSVNDDGSNIKTLSKMLLPA